MRDAVRATAGVPPSVPCQGKGGGRKKGTRLSPESRTKIAEGVRAARERRVTSDQLVTLETESRDELYGKPTS